MMGLIFIYYILFEGDPMPKKMLLICNLEYSLQHISGITREGLFISI